ncbi:MAG: hypothetical protein WC794_05430 [Candidatus Doudnabacteria bacterium]|jgi:hypothetical protein
MSDEQKPPLQPNKKNLLYRIDNVIKTFIPNFNVRAILYITLIFAVAMFLEIWRVSSPAPSKQTNSGKQETVLADQKYWDSAEYKDKIKNQTLDSFTKEFESWLNGESQEFSKRKFEDMLFINAGLSQQSGGGLTTIVPENFNYLENGGRARYLYAKNKGFLADQPTIVKLGNVSCNVDEKTEQDTGIELYDWRYTSMPKLAAFVKTYPDWKIQIADKIYNVQDPMLSSLYLPVKQKVGLFSFLIFHYPKTNKFVVANSEILDNNDIDGYKTLVGIEAHSGKLSKLEFKYGYVGCQQINNVLPQIDYGQSN